MSRKVLCKVCGKDLTKAVDILGDNPEVFAIHKASHLSELLHSAMVILAHIQTTGNVPDECRKEIRELVNKYNTISQDRFIKYVLSSE